MMVLAKDLYEGKEMGVRLKIRDSAAFCLDVTPPFTV